MDGGVLCFRAFVQFRDCGAFSGMFECMYVAKCTYLRNPRCAFLCGELSATGIQVSGANEVADGANVRDLFCCVLLHHWTILPRSLLP